MSITQPVPLPELFRYYKRLKTPWVVKPWLPMGALTLLVGTAKEAGKTTICLDLIASMLRGIPFLGEPVRKMPVIYVSEQSPHTFRLQCERANIHRFLKVNGICKCDLMGLDWDGRVERIERTAATLKPGLLVLDTWAGLAGFQGEGENHTGEAQTRLDRLSGLLSGGWSVLLVVHEGRPPKDGGTRSVAFSGRGASALMGGVDQIIQLTNTTHDVRHPWRYIQAEGRFPDTPTERLKIHRTELSAQTSPPLRGGKPWAENKSCVMWQLAEMVKMPWAESLGRISWDGWKTLPELMAVLRMTRSGVQRVLKDVQPEVDGDGTKGSPYRYKHPGITVIQASWPGMAVAEGERHD